MSKIYQLKIQLKSFKPSSYRIILVENTDSFYDLHNYIQNLFNFYWWHLFEFEIPTWEFGQTTLLHDPFDDWWWSYEAKPSDNTYLEDYLTHEKEKFSYTYDYWDDWKFTITLQKILDSKDLDIKKFPHLKKAQWVNCFDDCWWVWVLEELINLYEKKDYKALWNRIWWEEWDKKEMNEIMQSIVNPNFENFDFSKKQFSD